MKKTIVISLSLMLVLEGTSFAQPEWIVYDTSNSGLPENYIHSLAIDNSGNKWIGTTNVVMFDDVTWTIHPTCTDITKPIAIDRSGNIWVESWWYCQPYGCFKKFDGTNWSQYSNMVTSCISSISVDSNNNLWIGSWWGGLAKFDGNAAWVNYRTANSGLPSDYISAIAIDANDKKWIATNDVGLVAFDGINWSVYNTSNSCIPYDRIDVIAVDNNNKWIGKWDAGLVKFDGINCVQYDAYNSGLPDNRITCITIDPKGNIWIGTNGGLAKFDGNTWTVYNTSNSDLPDNYINAIAVDDSMNIWIGTTYGGLAVLNEGIVEDDNPKKDTLESEPIQLYPNPTSGQFVLSLPSEQPASIYIYNLLGKLILQSSIINNRSTIDISQHAKGIYLVKVIQGEEIFIRKLLHQ